tara:strand:+ start:1715 stop:3166 length:1452 start_codon:yes stop_codon:yes gene_type:complete
MKNLIFYLFFLTSINLLSQNHVDALRYSYLDPLGTARLSALSGSFSSLGGDLSSIHQNPAGLAIYRTDEVGVTLSSQVTTNEARYFNNSFQSDQSTFYIQNWGYVKTFRQNENKWNRFSFGLTYNRIKDFNEDIIIFGNSSESRVNSFLNNSQGLNYEDLNPFSEYLAFSTYLIDTLGQSNMYESAINSNMQNDISHQNIVQRSGYMDEFSVSMSGAYNDLLFVGLQIGFLGINYQELNSYTESGFEPNNNYEWGNLEQFIYSQDLNVIGGGLNYKLGLILKPVKFLRIGAAYHSKTHFEIEENWESSMTTSFTNENMGVISDISPYGFGNYTLRTPSKTISSLGFIIAKKGLINLELEQIDYSSSKLEADYYNFLEENSNISNFYKKTKNIRLGTEWNFGDISVRAGLGIYENPLSSNSTELEDEERIVQSFGIGYRSNAYFFDCAIMNAYEKQNYYMFNGSSATEISKSRQSLIFSLGYKF